MTLITLRDIVKCPIIGEHLRDITLPLAQPTTDRRHCSRIHPTTQANTNRQSRSQPTTRRSNQQITKVQRIVTIILIANFIGRIRLPIYSLSHPAFTIDHNLFARLDFLYALEKNTPRWYLHSSEMPRHRLFIQTTTHSLSSQ
ncbi:hypothetical protein Q427_15600 [Halomonas sp. BC04]|nr:hypothetical protein Q427_15600 [Halomonas sp. BC04]